ncbi:unnamed protein product [Calypogeia fissa]
MNEHGYFHAALNLYTTYDTTGALANADGRQYKVEDIQNAISNALDGHLPGIECNKDDQSCKQLYQAYICVSTDGSTLIDCPVFPSNECTGLVEFPVFDASSYSGSSQLHSSDSSEHSHSSYSEEARSNL